MIMCEQSNEGFDYQAMAELFPGKSPRAKSRVVKYMRFDNAAEAIRCAIEQLPTELLLGASPRPATVYACCAVRKAFASRG